MPPQTRSSAKRSTRSATRQKPGKVSVPQTKAAAQTSSKVAPAKAKSDKKKQPPRKRARRATPEPEPEPEVTPPKRIRGKQGKLQGLMNMPVDIFAEIAVHLYPIDLAYLARANKFFRKLLMSRSLVHVWRCAERNVEDLPPCPKELCEPQYAALVFVKCCSTCGEQALRPMDPVLQVRLCAKCRDKQVVDISRVTDSTLVLRSRDIVPGKHSWSQAWCLFKDARAVKEKLNALEREDDHEAKELWVQERRDIVNDRTKSAQPLAKFLKSIESEHDAELSSIRKQREAEVKSRLLKLGYNEGDITLYDRDWHREWKSVARIAKPLTERVWEAALPSLIAWLERNRERRLENEKSQRRCRRQTKIINWMNLLRRDSDPFARAFGPSSSGDPDPSHVLASDPSDANMSLFLGPPTMWDMRRLKRAFPASHQMIRWPIFETMMDQDVSIEELDQTLEQSKPAVDKLISEWTQELEQTLVSLLPEEPSSSKDTSNSGDGTATQIACPIPEYTCVQGDGSQMRPLTELPMDTQRLLRADSVFMRGYTVNFYPADFHGSYFDVKDMTHDPSIAKALLASLGLSDATFLQLQAAGRPFVCGRCNNNDRMTWKDAIHHYFNERRTYNTVQSNPRARAASFTYIYTHDIDIVKPEKPLLRVSAETQLTLNGPYYRTQQCLICKSIGAPYCIGENMMISHIQDVHLIETPEENRHYR